MSIILIIITIAVQFLSNISPRFTDVIFVAVLGVAFVINEFVFVDFFNQSFVFLASKYFNLRATGILVSTILYCRPTVI